MKPFLVVSSVGESSRHSDWLEGADNFDMALVDYAGGCPESPDYRLWRRAGTKWPNFDFLLEVWPEAAEYAAIAVLDDDLVIDGAALGRMFEVFQEQQLWLAQPSLRGDSAYSWAFTLQRPYLLLRYNAFVENNFTVLRGQDCPALRPAFAQTRSGYGLDWALPQLLRAPAGRVAVIDEVCGYHPPRACTLGDRNQHADEGDELCSRLGVTPLQPLETGFLLNQSGLRWAERGTSEREIYTAASRFAYSQMSHTFVPHRHGRES